MGGGHDGVAGNPGREFAPAGFVARGVHDAGGGVGADVFEPGGRGRGVDVNGGQVGASDEGADGVGDVGGQEDGADGGAGEGFRADLPDVGMEPDGGEVGLAGKGVGADFGNFLSADFAGEDGFAFKGASAGGEAGDVEGAVTDILGGPPGFGMGMEFEAAALPFGGLGGAVGAGPARGGKAGVDDAFSGVESGAVLVAREGGRFAFEGNAGEVGGGGEGVFVDGDDLATVDSGGDGDGGEVVDAVEKYSGK